MSHKEFSKHPQNNWTAAATQGNFAIIKAELDNSESVFYSSDKGYIETMLILSIVQGQVDFLSDLLRHPNIQHYLQSKETADLFEMWKTLFDTVAIHDRKEIVECLLSFFKGSDCDQLACIEKAQQYAKEHGYNKLIRYLQEHTAHNACLKRAH